MPTGGEVSVGLGYAREFKNQFNENLEDPAASSNLESMNELGGLGIIGSTCSTRELDRHGLVPGITQVGDSLMPKQFR